MTAQPGVPARRAPVEGRVTGEPEVPGPRLALVDLLDRVLAGGVVVTGEIVLSVADIDLVVVSLRALVTSVAALDGPVPVGWEDPS